MKEQHHTGQRTARESGMPQAFPLLGPEHFAGLLEAQRAVLKQGEAMARLWQDFVQDALTSNSALSSDLARSKTPQEAVAAYTDWLQGRYGRLTSDSQEAWRLWLSMAPAAALNGFADGKSSGKRGGERNGRSARHDDDKDD